MKKILVVAAHPDDEILGCGATLLKSTSKGAKVKTVIVSEGVTSRKIKNSAVKIRQIKDRHNASIKAHSFIKGSKLVNLNFPDQKLDTVSMLTITQKIETEAQTMRYIGYDTYMVFVNTTLEVAIKRKTPTRTTQRKSRCYAGASD